MSKIFIPSPNECTHDPHQDPGSAQRKEDHPKGHRRGIGRGGNDRLQGDPSDHCLEPDHEGHRFKDRYAVRPGVPRVLFAAAEAVNIKGRQRVEEVSWRKILSNGYY